MSVAAVINLPDEPAVGQSTYIPLGGNGTMAPFGCYIGEYGVAGDGSGGTASVNVNMDPRYTNLIVFCNGRAISAAAATEFYMQVVDADTSNRQARVSIVGTMPHSTVIDSGHSDFLWYPPPILFQQSGNCRLICPNIDTETYSITMECYVFVADIRRIAPLPLLLMNVPGVSAPASV